MPCLSGLGRHNLKEFAELNMMKWRYGAVRRVQRSFGKIHEVDDDIVFWANSIFHMDTSPIHTAAKWSKLRHLILEAKFSTIN